MERIELNEEALETVTGGSIVFNGDCTTCGRDCNNQYHVNNLNAVLQYISDNRNKMSEKTMLKNMVANGLLSTL